MIRENLLRKIEAKDFLCDILIIGGGATGIGIAVDAASRGYKVVLLEQDDFAKGTSSRSTKLVHGGVRYLAQGNIRLVIEALRERGRMRRNAPHLVRDTRFIIGNYKWWERPFYAIGLICYDLLAGKLGLGRSLPLSCNKVKKEIPGLKKKGLMGGVVYHDGQFDDSRMAITLLQTALDYDGICLNYVRVEDVTKDSKGKVRGVQAFDVINQNHFQIDSRVVINATGVFIDDILNMDSHQANKKVRPSQGVHLVVDKKFLGGQSALMIPKTYDGRVLFGVPWHDKVVLGTTDTPLNYFSLEPCALEEEIDFILDQAGQYLDLKPKRSDVLSVFAGLRPLAAPTNGNTQKTKEISRSHKIYQANSGLITITGGKWTTYRQMAEEVVDIAIKVGELNSQACITANMKLHGYSEKEPNKNWDYVYGSDCEKLQLLETKDKKNKELLHPDYSFKVSHVLWAAKAEMAQTVEDVLARRVRALFIDARAAIKMAPKVASILAQELGKNTNWVDNQIKVFNELAKSYLIKPSEN